MHYAGTNDEHDIVVAEWDGEVPRVGEKMRVDFNGARGRWAVVEVNWMTRCNRIRASVTVEPYDDAARVFLAARMGKR